MAQESADKAGDVCPKVLVVEDSALVVLSIEALLEDMNWRMEGPAAGLQEALRMAETTDADLALLDVNLNGERSWEVADRLKARGIPVLFTTGYDSATVLPEHLKGTPVVGKPFAISELEDLFRSLVERQ